jgi:hypothetical protein
VDSRYSQTNRQIFKQHSSTQDCIKTLTSLYQKCKRAHKIIVYADELEQLDRSSGMNSIPSSPHLNSSISTPRSTHASTAPISRGLKNMSMPFYIDEAVLVPMRCCCQTVTDCILGESQVIQQVAMCILQNCSVPVGMREM